MGVSAISDTHALSAYAKASADRQALSYTIKLTLLPGRMTGRTSHRINY